MKQRIGATLAVATLFSSAAASAAASSDSPPTKAQAKRVIRDVWSPLGTVTFARCTRSQDPLGTSCEFTVSVGGGCLAYVRSVGMPDSDCWMTSTDEVVRVGQRIGVDGMRETYPSS